MSSTVIPPVIIYGVGRQTLVYSDGSMLQIPKAQDLSIAVSATTGKQNGGDSPWPLLQFITEKTGKITTTDATFSLNQAYFTQGGVLATGAVIGKEETITPATAAGQLSATSNIDVTSVVAIDAVTGKALTRVTAAPTTGQFEVTTVGALTFNAADTTPVTFSYYYTSTDGVNLSILNDSIARPCELRHHIITDEMDDGNRYQVDLRVFKCRSSGSFNYDAKRGSAYSPKLEYEIMDSGRDDKKTFMYSVSLYTGV